MSEPGTEGIITCAFCGDSVSSLVSIETGMKLRLKEAAQLPSVPDQVCEGCFGQLAKMISKGAVLKAESAAKEQNRLLLWRNRVQLVKKAKSALQQKNYPDAAVNYEKYIRILEIVYECKPGELAPALFKSKGRSQEMTVIASVYWDLMRIYDSNNRYADRQMKAAEKLAAFVRFTPIFPQIMRKADSQSRTSKNPQAFKHFLKLSNSARPRCFIATAAFDGQRTETVDTLCAFRDDFLKRTPNGRKLITAYYKISPPIAQMLDKLPGLKPTSRKLLIRIARSQFVRNRLNT